LTGLYDTVHSRPPMTNGTRRSTSAGASSGLYDIAQTWRGGSFDSSTRCFARAGRTKNRVDR